METALLWPVYLEFSDPLRFLTRVTCLHVCLPQDSRLLKVIAHLFIHSLIHSFDKFLGPSCVSGMCRCRGCGWNKNSPFPATA